MTGIDFSTGMLAEARVEHLDLKHVVDLRQMDARVLDLPDTSFDTVAAMDVLSVVPEPEKAMAEFALVLKPGGRVVVTNHFVRERGFLAFVERISAPFANVFGWHSNFELETILQEEGARLPRHDDICCSAKSRAMDKVSSEAAWAGIG